MKHTQNSTNKLYAIYILLMRIFDNKIIIIMVNYKK